MLHANPSTNLNEVFKKLILKCLKGSIGVAITASISTVPFVVKIGSSGGELIFSATLHMTVEFVPYSSWLLDPTLFPHTLALGPSQFLEASIKSYYYTKNSKE